MGVMLTLPSIAPSLRVRDPAYTRATAMKPVTVAIFHRSTGDDDAPCSRLLAEARARLADYQAVLFRRAGADRVLVAPGIQPGESSWGRALARLVAAERIRGLVVLGSGAGARLRLDDARHLVVMAASPGRRAATNNRYSSDVCALSDSAALLDLPPLPGDNALPRWLEESAAFEVHELPGRARLAFDLDSPLDLAILAASDAAFPRPLRALAREHALTVPRLHDLRAVAANPRRELLVFGRCSSRTMAWLERNVPCRVRLLAEERGLRASTPVALAAQSNVPGRQRPPRATLGRLLATRDPGALSETVGEFADGAVIDSRVLLADRLGPEEEAWPTAKDRFASDLLRADAVKDPWLRAVTAAAAASAIPILLGGHTLVGPGVPLLLR